MPKPSHHPKSKYAESETPPPYGFWPFILPLLIFMIVGMAEPRFPTQEEDVLAGSSMEEESPNSSDTLSDESEKNDSYVTRERRELTRRFLWTYGFKVVIVTGFLIYFWRIYLGHFPWSVTIWSVVVGGVGILVWVGFCHLQLERWVTGWFTDQQAIMRSQFNPFSQLPDQWQLTAFLTVRFFGLVVMVPICEELFLRGFLMRCFEDPDWWKVDLGRLSFRVMLVAPAYGLMSHPTEAVAAIVWFSLVTWLVHHTGRFWDAVIAHAVTNMLLGLYVCYYEQWHLW